MQGWTLSADEIDKAIVCDLESSMPDAQMQCWQGSLHAARSGKAGHLRRQPIWTEQSSFFKSVRVVIFMSIRLMSSLDVWQSPTACFCK